MTSTKKKGQSKELLCAKTLQAEGYSIFFRSFTVRQGPIFRAYDFANIFDVIAGDPISGVWRFISVKHYDSDGGVPHREAIRKFAETYGKEGMSFEIWRWKKPAYYGRGKERKWDPGGFDTKKVGGEDG